MAPIERSTDPNNTDVEEGQKKGSNNTKGDDRNNTGDGRLEGGTKYPHEETGVLEGKSEDAKK